MTRTVHVERASRQHPEPLLEVHPEDAARVSLVDASRAVVQSRRGSLTVRVQVTDRIRPGTVFLPLHWGASQGELACEANRLMHELGCPISRQPELKGAAVRVLAAEGSTQKA
jgi:ferredoxin-nitrate reductase